MKKFARYGDRELDVCAEVPSSHGFIALLEAFRATGGTAPGEIVGRLMAQHQRGDAVSLAKLIYSGQAFGFEWRASLWVPMFQFDAGDLTLKLGAQRVRLELPSAWSGWNLATWFTGANARLDGRCPVDMLDSHFDAVLHAARSPAAAEEYARPLVRRAHQVAAGREM